MKIARVLEQRLRVLGGPENRPLRSPCPLRPGFQLPGPRDLASNAGSAAVSPPPGILFVAFQVLRRSEFSPLGQRRPADRDNLHVPAGPARPALPGRACGQAPFALDAHGPGSLEQPR